MSDIGVIINLDDQSIEQSKTVLDYTSRDFTAIRAQLVGLARGLMPDWKTAGESPDFGTLILELFAYMGDVMHYYIDRTASEAFLSTAVRRQSILYIADMMGYTPVGQQAASVQLSFSLQADDPEAPGTIVAVTIPQGTKVYSEAGNAEDVIVFETTSDITLQPGEIGIVGYANEGVSVNDTSMGLALGVPNTEFVIPDKGIIYGTVQVLTREGHQIVDWTHVAHLSLGRPTQAIFTTFMDDTGLTHVVFGDNTSGRIPPVNAEMFVSYRFGVGAEANALSANTVTTIAAVPNVDLFGLTVTNPNPPVGGSDPETIDAMRYSISSGGTRIKDRAVTLHDYADLAMQVPGVVKSVAHGTVYTAVRVRVAPPGGKADDNYMQRLLNTVSQYMEDKIMVGSSVYPEPQHVEELFHDIYIHVDVHVMDAYNRTAVRTQVESVLRQLLSFDAVDFGTRISMGLVYRAVLAVQGIEWAELKWLNEAAPVDTTDPGQGDITTVAYSVWKHSTSNDTTVSPGNQNYRRNNDANPTLYALAAVNADNVNVNTAGSIPNLMNLQTGDHLVVRAEGNMQYWRSMLVTGPVVNNTTWVQIPVLRLDESVPYVSPNNGQRVVFEAIRYKPTPDSSHGIHDIETPELLIPRIAPPITLHAPSTVSNKALTANVATLTTTTAHGLSEGDVIDVTGVDAVFNGTRILVSAVPTTTTVSYDKVNANVTAAAATGTITQIDPWRPESETDYPDLTEEERTHDGLWVKAVGGIANT